MSWRAPIDDILFTLTQVAPGPNGESPMDRDDLATLGIPAPIRTLLLAPRVALED